MRCTPRTAVTTPMVGPGERGEVGDIALHVHAHLQHRRLGRGGQAQQGQRQADLVVLVALVGQHLARRAQHGGDRPPWSRSWPREPVTPTTSGWKRARHAAATRPSAATPSSTSTTVVSPSRSSAGASGASLTSRAVAPAATASSRNRWPSVRAPGRATKRLPGSTRRESTAAPRIGRPPERSSRPPLAAARPGASKAGRAGLGGGSRVASVTVGRHSPTRPLTVASRVAARRGPRASPAAASARSGRPCWSRPRPGAGDPGPRWCPAPRGGTAGTT